MNATSQFWRLRRVTEETSLSKSQIYRLVASGAFPRPVKISDAASAFLSHEVREWMASRIAASRVGGGS